MELNFSVARANFPKYFPKIPGYVVSAPKITKINSDVDKLKIHKGAAFGFNDSTLDRALSEAVERYAVSVYKKDSFLLASRSSKELYNSHVPLEIFILFSKDQYMDKAFPYMFPGASEKIYWTQAYDYAKNKKVYIPASFVYPSPRGGWKQLDKWTSSGLAAEKTRDAVVLLTFAN